jgi:hypothetical protein
MNILHTFLLTHPGFDITQDVLDLVEHLTVHGVKIGGIYQHYKGDYYKVLGFVRDSEDWEGQLRVRYVSMVDLDHEVVRPLSMFLEQVDEVPRFKLVS